MKVPLSARDRGSLRYPPPGPPRLGPGGRSRLFRGSSSCQQNGSLPFLLVSVFPRVLPLFGLSPVPGRFPFFSRLRFSRGGAGGRIPAPLPGGARRMPETAFPAMRIRAGRPELPCAGSVVLHLPVRPGQRFSCYSVIHIVPPCCCDDNGIWPVFPSSSDVFPLRILTFTAIPGRSPPPGRDGIGPGNSESDLSLAPAVRLSRRSSAFSPPLPARRISRGQLLLPAGPFHPPLRLGFPHHGFRPRTETHRPAGTWIPGRRQFVHALLICCRLF